MALASLRACGLNALQTILYRWWLLFSFISHSTFGGTTIDVNIPLPGKRVLRCAALPLELATVYRSTFYSIIFTSFVTGHLSQLIILVLCNCTHNQKNKPFAAQPFDHQRRQHRHATFNSVARQYYDSLSACRVSLREEYQHIGTSTNSSTGPSIIVFARSNSTQKSFNGDAQRPRCLGDPRSPPPTTTT